MSNILASIGLMRIWPLFSIQQAGNALDCFMTSLPRIPLLLHEPFTILFGWCSRSSAIVARRLRAAGNTKAEKKSRQHYDTVPARLESGIFGGIAGYLGG